MTDPIKVMGWTAALLLGIVFWTLIASIIIGSSFLAGLVLRSVAYVFLGV